MGTLGKGGGHSLVCSTEGKRTLGSWERRTSALQPEESLEKIDYGKEIWKWKVTERREEGKERIEDRYHPETVTVWVWEVSEI